MDSPLPRTLSEAIPYIVWGVLIFTAGFEGISSIIDGNFRRSGISFALMILLMVTAIYGPRLLRIKVSEMTPWILVIVGALSITSGIWLLITRNNESSGQISKTRPNQGEDNADITWISEDYEHTGYAFLNMHREVDQPFLVDGFNARGRNNMDWAIHKASGYVFSEKQNKRYPLYLINTADSSLISLDDIEAIPAHAEFPMVAPFTQGWPKPKGMPFEQFLSDMCPITFMFEYDGKRYSRHFTTKEVEDFIIDQNKRSGYVPPNPKVEIKMPQSGTSAPTSNGAVISPYSLALTNLDVIQDNENPKVDLSIGFRIKNTSASLIKYRMEQIQVTYNGVKDSEAFKPNSNEIVIRGNDESLYNYRSVSNLDKKNPDIVTVSVRFSVVYGPLEAALQRRWSYELYFKFNPTTLGAGRFITNFEVDELL